MLICRTRDMQLFGFTPRGHRHGRRQAVGLALRVRARGRWRHVAAHVYWPRRDLRVGRGTLSFEVVSWLTGPGTGERLTVKSFIRLKLGLGGRSLS